MFQPAAVAFPHGSDGLPLNSKAWQMNGGPATAGVADTRAAAVTAAATSERLSSIGNSLEAGGDNATVEPNAKPKVKASACCGRTAKQPACRLVAFARNKLAGYDGAPGREEA